MRRCTKATILMLIIGVLTALIPAAAPAAPRVAQTVGAAFRISGPPATAEESWPAVAANTALGSSLVVWADARNYSTRLTDIYGRLVTATGERPAPDFRIGGPGATGRDDFPAAAYNSSTGDYLVVWEDRRVDLNSPEIYGRRISGAGSPLGPDFCVSCPDPDTKNRPAVAFDAGSGQFLVVWNPVNGLTGYSSIRARWVSGSGSVVGDSFAITGGYATYNVPGASYSPNTGQEVVVWADGRNYASRGSDIYARRIAAAGPVGGEIRISPASATADEGTPTIACSAYGDCLIAWYDTRDWFTRGEDIYARQLPATGSPTAQAYRISPLVATHGEMEPSLAYNALEDEYLLAWEEYRDPARGFEVYARRVSPFGWPNGAAFVVSPRATTTDERYPAVAYNASMNEFLVVWVDARDRATRQTDIWGRRVLG